MKFAYVGDDYPAIKGRVFEGPDTSRGLMGGFKVAEIRWAKVQLKISDIVEDLDLFELQVLYCLLAIRREDHGCLPFAQLRNLWENLAPNDFDRPDEAPAEPDDEDDQDDDQAADGVDPTPRGPSSTASTP